MHALAAVLAAGILGAVALPGGTGDARVEAGSAIYDLATGTYRLEGGVVVSRGLVRLRARSARWDPRRKVIEASGSVMLSDATRVLAADGLHAVVDGDFEAHGVIAFLKDGPVDLSRAASAAEAAACGRNALTARAEEVRSGEGGAVRLEAARLTPCDCQDGPPSWELRASSALLHPGDSVELTWPVVWVTPRFLFVDTPIPVLTLPWVSLPLGERVSGLLAPEFATSGTTGLTLAQPFFLVLGESADATFTPRYALGRSRGEVASGRPSVRGPGGAVEGRWTPAPGVAGRLEVEALWDLDDEIEGSPLRGTDGARGLRLAVGGGWQQQLGERTSLRLDLDLVGDPLYVRDFVADVLLRDATAHRSAALLEHRQEAVVLEVGAAWLEPVSSSGALAGTDGGLFGGKLPAFHRWPAVEATLLPVGLGGPVRLSGKAGLARFAPPNGITSGGGADGVGPGERWLPWRAEPDTHTTGVAWQPGERLAASRLSLRAELSAPFTVAGLVDLEPSVRGAAMGYVFDADRGPLGQAWGSAGLLASTSLVRRFGELRHAVEPRLEWRATTGVAGRALPAFGYDGLDRGDATPPGTSAAVFVGPRFAAAAPPGAVQQLRLSVATRLARGEEELLRGEIGQEIDLRRGALAEAFLRGAATRGLVSGEADLRLWTGDRLEPVPVAEHQSWLDRFSELRLKLTVTDGRGDELKAGLLAVGRGGSGRLGGGLDDLFDARATGIEALASGSVGVKVRFGPAAVAYEALLPVRATAVPACHGGTGVRTVGAWEVQQHTGSVEWDSPCRCFRVRAAVRVDGCGDLGGSFAFDLGKASGLAGR